MKLTRKEAKLKILSAHEDMKIKKTTYNGKRLEKIFFYGEPVGTLYKDRMSLSYDIDSDLYGMTSIEFDDNNASGILADVLEDLVKSKDWAERMERQERAKNVKEYFKSMKSAV